MHDEHRRDELAEAAEEAARQLESYQADGAGRKARSPARLRALRRAADRAKLALHRGRSND